MLCFSLIPGDVYNDFYRDILMFGAYILLSPRPSGERGVWNMPFPILMTGGC